MTTTFQKMKNGLKEIEPLPNAPAVADQIFYSNHILGFTGHKMGEHIFSNSPLFSAFSMAWGEFGHAKLTTKRKLNELLKKGC